MSKIEKIESKYSIHFLWMLLVIVCAIICGELIPKLYENSIATFATIGFFITLYGVIFAIVELQRAKSASDLAKAESKKVYEKINGLYKVKDIAECQMALETAINCLDKRTKIPATTLCLIIKQYSLIFHEEMKNDSSIFRYNRSIIDSYYSTPRQKEIDQYSVKLKHSLLSVMGQLSEAIGHKTTQGDS